MTILIQSGQLYLPPNKWLCTYSAIQLFIFGFVYCNGNMQSNQRRHEPFSSHCSGQGGTRVGNQ